MELVIFPVDLRGSSIVYFQSGFNIMNLQTYMRKYLNVIFIAQNKLTINAGLTLYTLFFQFRFDQPL